MAKSEAKEPDSTAGGDDWFNTGYEVLDDEDNWTSSQFYDYDDEIRRWWMPPGVERRMLIMDDNPATFWEQQFKYGDRNWQNWLVHLSRNGIAEHHPMDDVFAPGDKNAPCSTYFVGYHTVMDLTGYKAKAREVEREVNGETKKVKLPERQVRFHRQLLGAKAGSKKKPGLLHRLRRYKKKRGTLVGCIFDVRRSGPGATNTGDEWEFVTQIDINLKALAAYYKHRKAGDEEKAKKAWNAAMAEVIAYLKADEGDYIQKYTEDTVREKRGGKFIDVKVHVEDGDIEWPAVRFEHDELVEPVNYREFFQPMTVEQMEKLANEVKASRRGGGSGQHSGGDDDVPYKKHDTGSDKSTGGGGGWSDEDDDADIPF